MPAPVAQDQAAITASSAADLIPSGGVTTPTSHSGTIVRRPHSGGGAMLAAHSVPIVALSGVSAAPASASLSRTTSFSTSSLHSSRHVSFAQTTADHTSAYRRSTGGCCGSRRRRCCGCFSFGLSSRHVSPVEPIEPIRYVTADGVELPLDDEDLDDEYGYGPEDSYYSYDNDPKERGATKLHRFFRQEVLGIKLRHWVHLAIFFFIGVGLSAYLWVYFSMLAQDRLEERFGKLCNDRIILSSSSLHDTSQMVDVVAQVVEHLYGQRLLSTITLNETASLLQHVRFEQFAYGTASTAHIDGYETNGFIAGIGIAAVVNASSRASFEANLNTTILAWDNATQALVTAPITTGFYVPILVKSGRLANLMLDLMSVPYFATNILKLQLVARTQFGDPYYVANYSVAVGPEAGLSHACAFHTLDGKLSGTGGYRTFSMSPIRHRNFNMLPGSPPAADAYIFQDGRLVLNLDLLSGLVISAWDLTTWLHFTHILDGINLEAVVEVYSEQSLQGARLYNGYQSHAPPAYDSYYDDHPFNTTCLGKDPSLLYQDADGLGLSLEHSVAFSSSLSPSVLYSGLSWSARCTPTTSYCRANREWTAHVIGALTLAASITFTVFLLLQIRQMTAKEREVRFKNQVLTELQGEREKAERAGNAKTDFMAFLCHELRNPLHAVLSMSDSLKDTTLDADQSESVFTIHASSELMLAITNDILDLSKIEAGRIELEAIPMDVTALVQSLVRGNRSWAGEKGVTVVGVVDPAIAECNYVYADPTRLNQMLTNLITNAIKFTAKLGQVTIQVTVASQTPSLTSRAPSQLSALSSGGAHLDTAVALGHALGAANMSFESGQERPSTAMPSVSAPATPFMRTSVAGAVPSALPVRLRRPSGLGGNTPPASTSAVNKVLFLHPRAIGGGDGATPPLTPDLVHAHSFERVVDMHMINGGGGSGSGVELRELGRQSSNPSQTHEDGVHGLSPHASASPPEREQHRGFRLSSSRTVATFAPNSSTSTTTSPLLGSTAVNLVAPQPMKPKRVNVGGSPAGTPLFGAASPLSHAPASLQATLPLLLLNRHRRNESSNSPRLFGPSPPPSAPGFHSAELHPHPLSLPSGSPGGHGHAATQSLGHISPPARTRTLVLGARNNSMQLSSTIPGLSATAHSAADHTQLPGQPSTPLTTATTSPGAHRPSFSSRAPVHTRANSARNLTSLHAGHQQQQQQLSAAGQLSEEAEEFSRTHGQLGSVRLTFTVMDTGIGIPPEYMEALFEPYSQAKRSITRSHGGTGLGLAIVKRLGDLMDGEITVESEIGVGTAFSFTADFLIAKVPTPAMASMLRHIQPADADIGQVRYSNYTTLKITNEGVEPLPGEDEGEEGRPARPLVAPSPAVSSCAPPSSPSPLAIVGTTLELKDLSQVTRAPRPARPEVHRPLSLSTDRPQSVDLMDGWQSLRPQMSPHTPTESRMLSPSTGYRHLGITSPPCVATPTVVGVPCSPAGPVLKARCSTTNVTHSPENSISSKGDEQARGAIAVTSEARPSTVVPPVSEASASEPKPWILVVDDAAINRKILIKMLGGSYQIDQAENGLQAVEMVDANPSKYSVVLLDLMMPVMGGTEAMQQIRARGHTALPVIAVTANTMSEDIETCMALGFTSFLSKPYRKEMLRGLVEQHIGANPVVHTPAPVKASPEASPARSRRTIPPPVAVTQIMSTSNGQIIASLSPLPPSVANDCKPVTPSQSPTQNRRLSVQERPATPKEKEVASAAGTTGALPPTPTMREGSVRRVFTVKPSVAPSFTATGQASISKSTSSTSSASPRT